MTQFPLPVVGPAIDGKRPQPGETDGVQLDYLQMPGEMSTYTASHGERREGE